MMSISLGIDIGGSTTKIVGLDSGGNAIAMRRVQAQDPITSLYGAMGSFLFTNNFQLSDVSRIALTGVGASYVEGDIYGIPTEKVEEFTAVGVGGRQGPASVRVRRRRRNPGGAVFTALRHTEVRANCEAGLGRGY